MIYKFKYPANLFKGLLNSFKGYYNALYIPRTRKEKFCYASLTKSQVSNFVMHFGANGGCTVSGFSSEYPGSEINKMNKRIRKFMRFEHPAHK